jgi:hypothetical protein
MKIWALIFSVLLAPAAFAADLFDNAQPRPYKLADPLEPDATLGGYPLWKGEGKWRIFKIERHDSTGGSTSVPIGDLGLFQTEGKKLVSIMVVSGTLSQSNIRWLGEPCKRDNMLYKANIGRSMWEDNCVTINHITNYANNPGGKDAELYALLVNNGVEPPPTVLRVEFTRNGTNGNFYKIQLVVNPEVMGFARETEPNWGRSPWNKIFSYNDPAKKQFIDALSAWALQFARRMDDGLDKKQDAFAVIPSWRTVLDGATKSEITQPAVKLN